MKKRLENFQKLMRSLEFGNEADFVQYFRKNSEQYEELKELSLYFLNDTLKGCGNCIGTAAIRLLKLDVNTVRPDSIFKLKFGAVLYDTENFDSSKTGTNANITDELAIWHLKQDPRKIKYFLGLPENFDIADFNKDNTLSSEEVKEEVTKEETSTTTKEKAKTSTKKK